MKTITYVIIAAAVLGAILKLAAADPAAPHGECRAACSLRNDVDPDIRRLYVARDGSCYTYSSFGVAAIYRQGKYIRTCTTQPVIPDGAAIAGNSNYIYISCHDLIGNAAGIFRTDLLGAPAPYQIPGKSGGVVDRNFTPVGHSTLRSIAVSDTALYVSVPEENIIRVFDPKTMAPTGWFDAPRAGLVAVDSAQDIWVEQTDPDGGSSKVVCYDSSGAVQPRAITFAPGVKIQALACSPDRNLLLIADNGADQNIKIYDLNNIQGSPTDIARTIGARGGIYSRRAGQVDDDKLNGPCGVGVDGAGNIVVASCNAGLDDFTGFQSPRDGSDLKCFEFNDSRLLWKLSAPITESGADFDPAIESDIYTADRHLLCNFARPTSRAWTDNGYTLERFRFPDDPRLVFSQTSKRVWVCHLNSSPYLYVAGDSGNFLAVYRFNKAGYQGEIGIPAVLFVKQARGDTSWPPAQALIGTAPGIWRLAVDRNDDGHFQQDEFSPMKGVDLANGVLAVDRAGGIWTVDARGVARMPLVSFDEAGVPTYDSRKAVHIPIDSTIGQIVSLLYDSDSDNLYLSAKCSGVWSIVCFRNATKLSRTIRTLPLPIAGITHDPHAALADVTSAGKIVVCAASAPSSSITMSQIKMLALPDPQAQTWALRFTRSRSGDLVILDTSQPQEVAISHLDSKRK